jgi:hypothetical protein
MLSSRPLTALLVAAGLFLTASAEQGSAQSNAQSSACVYLLRGLGGRIFTSALDKLAAKIRERNICAVVGEFDDYRKLAEDAAHKYTSGEIQTVIIIGQSLGGGMATRMAKSLNGSGVPVGLLLTVDPTFPLKVAANVASAINLYLPYGVGRKLEPAADFHGQLFNLNQKNISAFEHIWSFAILEDRILGYVTAAAAAPATDATGAIPPPPSPTR